MSKTEAIQPALEANFRWFERSGIMDPPDCSWGVAERILLTRNNTALSKTLQEFPARRNFGDYLAIEHRRPDCNFQTALAYALDGVFGDHPERLKTAEELMTFVYCRTAARNTHSPAFPYGTWRWSDDRWNVPVWYDDNSWCTLIPILLANLVPEWDEKFQLKESAAVTAHELYRAMILAEDRFGNFARAEFVPLWNGFPQKPHFGSLACMALAAVMLQNPRDDYRHLIESYHRFLERDYGGLNTSECSYALIGATLSAAAGCDTLDFARRTARMLLGHVVEATGNLPSENGREAPVGKHLVDLIYTFNWAVLGFQMLQTLEPAPEYQQFLDRSVALLLEIQDHTDCPGLNGCWRGMFDLEQRAYGGGDCYEGGANSIYSGWTNAPLNCFLNLYRQNSSFVSLANKTLFQGVKK